MLDNRARDFLSQQKGWRWDSARFPLKKIYYFKNINKNSGLRKKSNSINWTGMNRTNQWSYFLKKTNSMF